MIMLLLLLFAPACLTTLLNSRFNQEKRSAFQLVLLTIVFAFFINLLLYAAFWVWGFDQISWAYDGHLGDVAFLLKTMVLSLIFACLLAPLSIGVETLLRGLKKIKKGEEASRTDPEALLDITVTKEVE